MEPKPDRFWPQWEVQAVWRGRQGALPGFALLTLTHTLNWPAAPTVATVNSLVTLPNWIPGREWRCIGVYTATQTKPGAQQPIEENQPTKN